MTHLIHLLDGAVLTQRTRAPLAARPDLWCTVAMQPLLNITAFTPLLLADGSGSVTQAASGHPVLPGPADWLPDVPRYGVVGIRLGNGELSAVPIDEGGLPDLQEQERTRQFLAHHNRVERWYSGDDDLGSRPRGDGPGVALRAARGPQSALDTPSAARRAALPVTRARQRRALLA